MNEIPTTRRPAKRGRPTRLQGSVITFFLVTLVGMVTIFALASRAQAFSSDLTAARGKYPFIANTRLDDCTLCHMSGSKALNPYGQAFLASGRNFAAIEGLDSDGDGYTNLSEIQALSFPGNAGDIPVQPTPTNTPFPPVPPTPTPTVTPIPPTATKPPPTNQPPPTQPPHATQPPPTHQPPPATQPPTATLEGPGATPTGAAPTPLPNILDLDIRSFKVTSHVKMDKIRPIELRLDIKNAGFVNGQGTLTVIGVQNGAEVYHQSMTVSDNVGGGHSRYYFPSYTPLAPGDIVWTATLSDEDMDIDQAVKTTQVSGVSADEDEGENGSLDLDIHAFRVTPRLKYDKVKPIDISLEVQNAGMVNGQATATVIGMQGGVEIYNQTLAVFDLVGGGHSRFHFPSYLPLAPGEIVWTVTIGDANPDDDTLMFTTLVEP